MTKARDTSPFNRQVLWRLGVAAVLCTAATAGILVFSGFLFGQLIVPSGRAQNVGLYAGVASIAALTATVLGLAGGLAAAVGAMVGLLIAWWTGLRRYGPCILIGVGAAVGSLGAFAASRPSIASWGIGAFGALLIGSFMFVLASRLTHPGRQERSSPS